MGKKLSQNSVKIFKKEKKEFNSLIRLLRPKVYITDSSSFKTLVQDLTGNGACSNSVPPQEQIINIPDVVDVGDHDDVSTDAAADDSSEALCNNQVLMSDDEFNQLCYQIYSDDTTTATTPPTTTFEGSSEEQVVLMDDIDVYSSLSSPFQDLESWLLDTDDHSNQGFDPFFNNGYYAQFDHHQQVSIYDYGLEGLL